MKNFESSSKTKDPKEIRELVSSAQMGDENAFECLRSAFLPLLDAQASKHISEGMTVQDIEDLKQEALIVFGNAVRSYNPDFSGVEFGLYAKICIENRLVSFVRSYIRQRKNTVVPLDALEEVIDRDSKDLFQAMVDRETGEELVRSIKKILSDYENRVWWLYVSGMSVSGIAEEIGGVSPKSVSNAVYRIRKKLRDHLSESNKTE